ncbi:hypothetical protein E2C01_092091 [Portunus trituberculatus]|uniref:Uncharacterized protein n=1 Tax=Portunus trituberculatus TaxID=210409 RepID=A0A5B7JQU2_PORTR|nr:hypothetical protein [Portunus trituberculatus]
MRLMGQLSMLRYLDPGAFWQTQLTHPGSEAGQEKGDEGFHSLLAEVTLSLEGISVLPSHRLAVQRCNNVKNSYLLGERVATFMSGPQLGWCLMERFFES